MLVHRLTRTHTLKDKTFTRTHMQIFILQFTHKNVMRYNFAYSDYMANRYLKTVATEH